MLAKGKVAALAGAKNQVQFFQFCLPKQPGHSGGALVHQRGNVVGALSVKLSAGGDWGVARERE